MPTIVMMGNPGAGKSTLLSGLVEKAVFHSGPSIGGGKTKTQQHVVHKGDTYVDTPGLSDIKLRDQAATEIMKAFHTGGKYKLFFVVTLESGRVKPDDVTTIKLVLDAITHIKPNEYSIIINKLSDNVISMLSEEQKEELATCLVPPSIGTGTRSIFYVPLKQDLVDQTDKCGERSPDLVSFIANAPEINLSSDVLRAIQHANFEKIVEELRHEIQLLRDDNAKLRLAMAAREEQLRKFTRYNPANNSERDPPLPTELSPRSAPSPRVRSRSHSPPRLSANSQLRTTSSVFKEPQYSILFIGDSGTWESSLSTTYNNVPRLYNIRSKEAANQIEQALRRGGKSKVFFIVEVEHDRINPEHLATMKLVLKAAPQIKDQYSIIIKMSKEVEDALRDSKVDWKELTTGIVPHYVGENTRSIICVTADFEWADDTDQQRLRYFIEKAPEITITSNRISTINHKKFADVVNQLMKDSHPSHASLFRRISALFKK